MRLPSYGEPLALDEHCVEPELSREEVVGGRRMIAQPARPPHGDQHFRIDHVVGAHVGPGYVGSTDLLTRVDEGSDFATDTCVRKEGIDPETGGRYLEELAFEVVYEQSFRSITERAEALHARGVRRIFAIFVKSGEVREWSAQRRGWLTLDEDGVIKDPCLVRPITVRALLDATEAEDEVTEAVLVKRTPALVNYDAIIRREAKAHAIGMVLQARGISLDDASRERILACRDIDTIERWLVRAAVAKSVADVFSEG